MKPKEKDHEPMHIDELDAAPGATDVSAVAQGGHAEPQQEAEAKEKIAHAERLYGKDECTEEDMDNAYSMLFEALAIITKR